VEAAARITLLRDTDTDTPLPVSPTPAGIEVVDLGGLAPGDLSGEPPGAVLYPIVPTTDRLHEEVEALRARAGDTALISYSCGLADDGLRSLSQRLGFSAHIEGPLPAGVLEETVRRERRLAEATEALRRTREEARREHEKLTHLIEIIKTANSVLEPSRVIEVVMEKTRDSVRCEVWCLFLAEDGEERLVFERSGGTRLRNPEGYSVSSGTGIEGAVLRGRRPVIVNDAPRDPRFDPAFDRVTGLTSRAVLAVPLISRGRIIGVVSMINRVPGDAFSPADQSLLTLLMEPAGIALENAILFKRMEQLSITDDLTRLYNMRYLNSFLYREIKRCRRYRLPVSVVFLDMDGFKTVNDRFGHLAGSQTLTEIGRLLRDVVREIDVVARYGGDEFVVVLPQTDPEGALIIAERIRRRIETTTFLGGMGLGVRLTASLGVASFPEQGRTRDELVHKADAAMYRVKESGKNGVLLAS